ncbi:MAG: transcriptional repressor [Candidatus Omnitrophota bacterium]
MKQSEQILRDSDIKVTPQRLAVYGIFKNTKGHFSAEQVFQASRLKVPAISLGTVYAILENFTAKHLIHEIKINFDKSLYEVADKDHHHFFCHECQKILDVEMPACATLRRKSVQGHTIESFQGYFYGICQDCQKKNKVKKG